MASPHKYSPQSDHPTLPVILKRIIVGLLWTMMCVPLVVSAETLFPYQTGKGMVLRVLAEVAGFFTVWLAIIDPNSRPRPGLVL